MNYLKGYTIKPYEVTPSGEVLFTDGTNNKLKADQITCQAYGYKFDNGTGTCVAFVSKPALNKEFSNLTNIDRGANNTTELGTENTFTLGSGNSYRGLNRNGLIVGNEHEIENGFDNSSVLGGSRAIITRDSEVAIGGGIKTLSHALGEGDPFTINSRRQTSTIELAGTTVDNTATNLTVQGDGSSYINVKANSIIGYDIYITRLELGGSSGTKGNYSYRNIRGAVKIDNSYTMSFVVGFSRNIAKIGQNGTCIMADTSTSSLKSISVNVQDRNNVHNLWSASVTLHEVISETTL